MKTIAPLVFAAFSLPACMIVPVAEPIAVERHYRHGDGHHRGSHFRHRQREDRRGR